MSEVASLPNLLYPEFWARPMPEIEVDLETLRAAGSVHFLPEPEIPPHIPLVRGPGSWVVLRHAEVLEVSKHPDVFSSASGITLLDSPPEFNEFFSSMIAMDDPRHARLRKIVSAGFTPRMLRKLEDSVQAVARQIVDEVATRGECDFVVDIAAALPLRIVCDLMGIPESEYQFVFEQSNIILGAGDPEYVAPDGDVLTAVLNAGAGLAQLMDRVAKSKVGTDADDLTSILVNANVDGDQLSHGDLASFFILLTVAGNETTRNAISWGLRFLTDNPDQRAIWAADFDRVAPSAVEEIIRLASPVTYMRRTVTRDTNLGGKQLKAGDKICMFYLSANRDEDVFSDPLRFDVLRAAEPRPRRFRRSRTAFLPRRPPGPPRDHGDVPGAVRAPARHRRHLGA